MQNALAKLRYFVLYCICKNVYKSHDTVYLASQWAEFILFGALLVAVAIIFSIMGYFYVPVDTDDLKDEDDTADDIKKPIPDFYETSIDASMEEKKTKI